LNLSGAELEKIGLSLGSDVPFFLRGGTCLAGGRGEELQRLPVQGTMQFVLVTPPLRVSSQWAYEQVSAELTRSGSSTSMIKVALASHRAELLASHLTNDLEPGVVAKHPVIADIKKQLVAAGALAAQMSGSGPTVFGLAASVEDAERIERTMEAAGVGKVVRASSIDG
jgi:4-diphosphocytidyl-2-C-methyl-D-erythritol kinase